MLVLPVSKMLLQVRIFLQMPIKMALLMQLSGQRC